MKALLFDFDGTLVDSMPCWTEKVLNILRITNTPYPENIIELITPLGDRGTAEYFKNELGVPLSYSEMFELMDSFALPKYRDEIPLKESVAEFLKEMSAKYSLNVLTASPHKMLDPCLKRLGIYDVFDNVWSCDDFETTKSDVMIYKRVAEKLQCDVNEIAFFDDNIVAVETAKTAGLVTVGVYDKTAESFKDKMLKGADLYVYSFKELLSNEIF